MRAPNQSDVAERVVQRVRQEGLDHFGVFGEAHLHYILAEYLAYYHQACPHPGLDNRPLSGEEAPARSGELLPPEVLCEEHLGSLLRHYRRAT